MTILDPRVEESLRRGFRNYLNPFLLMVWRLGLGRWFNVWPDVSGRVMVITHIGRKSGGARRTPVNYAIVVGGDIYCVAAFGSISDWYLNVRANPNVQVWLPEGWWAGTAEDVSGDPRRLLLMRQVLIGSGFAARVAGINPYAIGDAELGATTARYRLIRIRRTEARTGSGGPGDLAWVWPLATLILLPLVIFRRKRRSS